MISEKDQFSSGQELKFLAWIRKQRSVLSGSLQNIQACHIRRVCRGSGTGIKPKLMAVPMTMIEHYCQTNQGYKDAIMRHGSYKIKQHFLNSGLSAIEWFEERALEYRDKFLEFDSKI